MNYIQGIERNQTFLFPSTFEELIAEDNMVRVIDAFVNSLDMEELGFNKSRLAGTGRSPYHPRELLKLYFYGYVNKIRSSRNLAKECNRNIEVMWLIKGVKPRYKTIADFRKNHPGQFRKIFKQFVSLCHTWGLYGNEMVGIDSSGFRAINSKKNNYNQKKIDRHLAYIEEKIEDYLKELDSNDTQEKDVKQVSREELQQRLETLKKRQAKYKEIEKQLHESGAQQISTIDSDSRLLVKNGQPAEVGYNTQVSVDEKNKLIVDYKTTNQNDRKQLHDMATRAKEELKVEDINVLADKGYHNAEELHKCQQENITTYVGVPHYRNNSPLPASGYNTEDFEYDKQEDSYRCPQGNKLITNGKFYKKPCRNGNFTLVKHYHTRACKECPAKHLCTDAKNGRIVERSQYQEAVDANTQRVKADKEKYLQRQMIVEHPFGTIKRSWGYNHVMVKGLNKADGEFGLIFLCYNLRRAINIFGVKALLDNLIAFFGQFFQLCTKAFEDVMNRFSKIKRMNNTQKPMYSFCPLTRLNFFVPEVQGRYISFCTV